MDKASNNSCNTNRSKFVSHEFSKPLTMAKRVWKISSHHVSQGETFADHLDHLIIYWLKSLILQNGNHRYATNSNFVIQFFIYVSSYLKVNVILFF